MKCKECNTEMFIDRVDEADNTEVFHYKCPNPECKNYGYKKEAEQVSFFIYIARQQRTNAKLKGESMEENLSVEMQEVAEPVEEVVETSEQTQEVAEPETQTEETASEPAENAEITAEPKVETRDYEKDAAYARMRREKEDAQKELESIKAEKERLAKAFGWFGFNGTTDEIEDQAKAHYTGRNVEEIRQERIAQAQKEAEQNQLREELKYYKQKEVNERMNKDLAEIQKLNPNIKSFEDLPEQYFNLVKAGVNGTEAYMAIYSREFYEKAKQHEEQQAAAKAQANAKASVGSAGSGEVKEKVTYANMSDAEFEQLLAKVKRGEMASITQERLLANVVFLI